MNRLEYIKQQAIRLSKDLKRIKRTYESYQGVNVAIELACDINSLENHELITELECLKTE